MKMSKLEKLFVNNPGHSRQVTHHAEALLRRIDFKAGQHYLDVGCGNGAAPIYLARGFHLNVTGVDVDPDQIRLAEQESAGLSNARFMTVDGTKLPFDEGEFDIAFTNKVMHHIPYWEAALAEMVRVLKRGGYLIYADLVFPGWLAAVGQAVANRFMGFPTGPALDAFFEQQPLAGVHRSKSWVHYEAILRKQ